MHSSEFSVPIKIGSIIVLGIIGYFCIYPAFIAGRTYQIDRYVGNYHDFPSVQQYPIRINKLDNYNGISLRKYEIAVYQGNPYELHIGDCAILLLPIQPCRDNKTSIEVIVAMELPNDAQTMENQNTIFINSALFDSRLQDRLHNSEIGLKKLMP